MTLQRFSRVFLFLAASLLALAACSVPLPPRHRRYADGGRAAGAGGTSPTPCRQRSSTTWAIQPSSRRRFPEDSRFRNMPVRLNGLIGVPSQGGGPFPVVVILHGTHPGCPLDETSVDRGHATPTSNSATTAASPIWSARWRTRGTLFWRPTSMPRIRLASASR